MPLSFVILRSPEPPAPLCAAIMRTVRLAREKQFRIRIGFAFSGLLATAVFAISRWSLFSGELVHSSFFDFLSLVRSDSDILFANAQELFFGFLEAIPLESILFTALALFFVTSLFGLFLSKRHLYV